VAGSPLRRVLVLLVRAVIPCLILVSPARFTAFFPALLGLISAALEPAIKSCDSSLVTRVTVPAAVPNLRATVFNSVSPVLEFFLVTMFSSGNLLPFQKNSRKK
jgi:hypothetical protein